MKTTSRRDATRGEAATGIPMDLPVDAIVPDEHNRVIDETEEDFRELVESVRVLGVLQRVHVKICDELRHVLIDGERRWRASIAAGRTTIPCEVWPDDTSARDLAVAGLVMNEQRKAHGSLHVARRLRQIKNEFGETQEELATRTGLLLGRVKSYLALFGASDTLLDFFEKQDLPLRIACEFMRCEKALGEAVARRLTKQYVESPMTVRELERLRKRQESGAGAKDNGDGAVRATRPCRPPSFRRHVKAAFRADRDGALRELEEVASELGLRVVVVAPTEGGAVPR